MAFIAINLVSDFTKAVTGMEPQVIVGVSIAFALLVYLFSKGGSVGAHDKT